MEVPYRGSDLTADTLGEASREISAVLDAYDVIAGSHVLEVSTPGLDRPLLGEEDFRAFQGHELAVSLHASLNGRRKIRGINGGVENRDRERLLLVKEDSGTIEVPLDRIRSANLVVSADTIGSRPREKPRRKKRRGR